MFPTASTCSSLGAVVEPATQVLLIFVVHFQKVILHLLPLWKSRRKGQLCLLQDGHHSLTRADRDTAGQWQGHH